jgi:putative transposase
MDTEQETIFKTVHQYSKGPVPAADMEKLEAIAKDYCQVKNYVYQRYGGIHSLSMIHPGYTVQNEMTKSGLRTRLGLPAAYFYCAVFDALGDIKSQWSHTRVRIEKSIRNHPDLTLEERHYLRFAMKQSLCFEAVLMGRAPDMGGNWQKQYDRLRAAVEGRRLDQYLRRQVRKHLKKLHTDAMDGFSVTAKGYRYGDHGIYLSTKENRKRVFIPLTDNNQYDRQLHVAIDPASMKVRVDVPIEVKAKNRTDYCNEVGLAVGMTEMLVTDQGSVYGGRYGSHQEALTKYVREGQACYRKNRQNNPGRKKYYAGKERLEAALHTYVNAEINRLLKTEKPGVIYIPKLPAVSTAGINRKINQAVSMWQRGYVRNRLEVKCKEHSVEFVEVFGKEISRQCSSCGAAGSRENGIFSCTECGLTLPEKHNTARNALNRGKALKEEKVHYGKFHR